VGTLDPRIVRDVLLPEKEVMDAGRFALHEQARQIPNRELAAYGWRFPFFCETVVKQLKKRTFSIVMQDVG